MTVPSRRPFGRAARAVPRPLVRLVASLHRWAESGWAGSATATWELLQSSFVPGPSGVVLVPLAIADPRRAWRLALWGAAGAILGGCIAYAIGAGALDTLGVRMLALFGASERTIAASASLFARYGALFVFASAITPLSAKITCIAAGAFGVPLWEFLPAIAAGRAVKFALLAVLARLAGRRLAREGLPTED